MTIAAGFADPALGAQAIFRRVLEAIAHPGRIVAPPDDLPAPPAPLLGPAYGVALSLLDFEAPVWLDAAVDSDAVRDSLRLHCGCPIEPEPGRASFALLGAGASTPLAAFAQGTPGYPDRSATLIWQVEVLGADDGVVLRGPGIRSTTQLRVDGLPADFWPQWALNHRQFPLGVDVVFVAPRQIAALPRSIEAQLCT